MSNFVIELCTLKACQHWRIGNSCVKNNQSIQNSIKYVANMHSSSVCEVRRQIDNYRLENLLEDNNEQNK